MSTKVVRTRFFTRKGSGTFFVYRRFCGGSTQNGEQERTKAGYHHGGGALPFVLRDQGRFVRTWSPLYGGMGQSLRTQEKGQALTYRGVLSLAGVIYFAQFKQIGI